MATERRTISPTRSDRIPDEKDWGDPGTDLDWAYAKKVFLGKNLDEAGRLFLENPIERTDELRFSPPVPFRYYLRAFARAVQTPETLRGAAAADAASCFIRLVTNTWEQDPARLAPVLEDVLPALHYVASHQCGFDADTDIYGDFAAMLNDMLREYG